MRLKTLLKFVAMTVLVALATLLMYFVANKAPVPIDAQTHTQAQPPTYAETVLYVSPHPDDEFQMWSLVENRPNVFKIFVTMTKGEETGFCEPENLEVALQSELGELPPAAIPDGRWSDSCAQSRMASLSNFLTDMGRVDETIPANFGGTDTFVLPEQEGFELCRQDGEEQVCGEDLRQVDVTLDLDGRGAMVTFNLGDGDLDETRVAWAIEELLESLEDFGLPPTESVVGMAGAFATNNGELCYSYPHPDHLAVRETLRNHNFGVGPQLTATCSLNPARSLTVLVAKENTSIAFNLDESGHRLGAHEVHYGWLHGSTYPLGFSPETELFHRLQSFQVSFNN